MNRASELVGLAAIAASLIAAGCGDDEEAPAASPTQTSSTTGITGAAETKEQWVATANEVCANAGREIAAAADEQQLTVESSPDQTATFVQSVALPLQQSVIDTLRGLVPPEGEEDAVNQILDAAQSAVDEVSADPALQTDLEATNAVFDEADALANEYGIGECGDS